MNQTFRCGFGAECICLPIDIIIHLSNTFDERCEKRVIASFERKLCTSIEKKLTEKEVTWLITDYLKNLSGR